VPGLNCSGVEAKYLQKSVGDLIAAISDQNAGHSEEILDAGAHCQQIPHGDLIARLRLRIFRHDRPQCGVEG
jgi:hypothetical protein